jgi:hypothetical protein
VGLRLASFAVVAAAAAACFGAPAAAARVNARVKAKVIKPLVIASVQDLDLGTVILGPGTWSGATLRLSQGGVLTCPSSVTCTGATQVAVYSLSGSQGQTVSISVPDVILVNQSTPGQTLTLDTDSPATLVLGNSGKPGTNFSIGGSITLDSTTADGDYVGTFNVTADYQ